MITGKEIKDSVDRALALKNRQLRTYGKHIIIVEGPAGAGKSFLLDSINPRSYCEVISRSLHKREFGVGEAVTKSFHNDLNKLAQAISSIEPVVFIDRCIISQRVYHALRTNSVPHISDIRDHIQMLADTMERDLAARYVHISRKINMHYLFLIPSLGTLDHRRSQSKKTYPNPSIAEIIMYKRMAQEFLSASVSSCFVPGYDTAEDMNYITMSLQNWIRTYPNMTTEGLWKSFITTPRMGECVNI